MRALKALLLYDFPGNVRELQNLIERGLIASDEGRPIDILHLFHNEPLPPQLYSLSQSGTLSSGMQSPENGEDNLLERLQQLQIEPDIERLERRLLDDALSKAEGNLAAAARLLGLTRAQFAYRLKKHASQDASGN